MKRVIILCVAAAVMISVIVTGSVAYFTDAVTTSANVIAAGNLDIVQHEWERGIDASGNVALVSFEQNKDFLPSVGTQPAEVAVKLPAELGEGEDPVEFSFTMHSGNIRNYVDKIVCAENKGSIPAYVRTYVAVPTYYSGDDLASRIKWIHPDFNTAGGWTLNDEYGQPNVFAKQTIGGVVYDIYVATLTHSLSSADIKVTAQPAATPDPALSSTPAPEEYSTISTPSLVGFYMDSKVTNEDGYFVYEDENGAKYRLWETKDSKLSILVCTAAAQARVFGNVWEAMDATYPDEAKTVVAKMQAMVMSQNTTS